MKTLISGIVGSYLLKDLVDTSTLLKNMSKRQSVAMREAAKLQQESARIRAEQLPGNSC